MANQKGEKEAENPVEIPIWSCRESEKINDILRKSTEIQKSLRLYSNISFFVAGTLRHFLLELGIFKPEEIEFFVGVSRHSPTHLDIQTYSSEALEELAFTRENTHCWLEVRGQTMDNAFLGQLLCFFGPLQIETYTKVNPIEFFRQRSWPEDFFTERAHFVKHSRSQAKIEQLMIKHLEQFPKRRKYYEKMKSVFEETFETGVVSIAEKWRNTCWRCNRPRDVDLKSCKNCKLAMYCGHKCQKKDWKVHKLTCGKVIELSDNAQSMEAGEDLIKLDMQCRKLGLPTMFNDNL